MVKFSEHKMKEVEAIIARYPTGKHKSALIPILHLAQEEFGGWLSAESMDYVASILSISSIEVYEVATFYSMFNLNPVVLNQNWELLWVKQQQMECLH